MCIFPSLIIIVPLCIVHESCSSADMVLIRGVVVISAWWVALRKTLAQIKSTKPTIQGLLVYGLLSRST